LSGGGGGDVLNGGVGNDSFVGGAGADTFVFDTALNAATNVDHITDFSSVDDRIQLAATIFAQFAAGALPAGTFVANANGQAVDGNDYLVYDNAGPGAGNLFYDNDGNGANAAVLFAVLDGTPGLGAADFTVV
jgi:Ca2+-binding RTX toxin-like protein